MRDSGLPTARVTVIEVAGHDGEVRRESRAYSTACIIMLGEGEVDDGVLRKKLGSSVVVADQDIIVVGAGSCYLTSRSSSSEVNTIKSLLYSDYIVQRRTYDLNGNKSEGHMGQFIGVNFGFAFLHMEAVVIIAIENDEQEQESGGDKYDPKLII